MLILTSVDLLGLLPPLKVLEAVENALRAQEQGQIVMPKRLHLSRGDNTFLLMPALVGTGLGLKVVSVIPDNRVRGLPAIRGLMILIDTDSGEPLALLDAGALTAQRTGAVGALGVKYMTPADSHSIGIIGCGMQGIWQAIFACAVRPIREIFFVGRSRESVANFIGTLGRYVPDAKLTACQDTHELLGRTTIVIAATTSREPVLPDHPPLLVNKHFISVGSYRPDMQELPDSVYSVAGHLAVDSDHTHEEVGDVINALRRKLLRKKDIFSIAECITGKRLVDTKGTTAYKSVGAAFYDLFVAQTLYQEAVFRGVGREVLL